MRAVLAALLLAAMPVRPVSDIPQLLGRHRPVVLHFFASWCGACRDELPALQSRLLKLPSSGVSLELITIDRPEDRAKAEQMLEEFGLDRLPAMLIDAPDPDPVAAAVGDPKWDGTLPATFVYDARGTLVRSFIGRIDDPTALDSAIRSATR